MITITYQQRLRKLKAELSREYRRLYGCSADEYVRAASDLPLIKTDILELRVRYYRSLLRAHKIAYD